MKYPYIILGAGMTGLAAGFVSGAPIFEAEAIPGGICASYYLRPGEPVRLAQKPADQEVYRFEPGGGHWIFGGAPEVLQFIENLTPARRYNRHSAVYFCENQHFVPYPLQNHLRYLPRDAAARALAEMSAAPEHDAHTMRAWLTQTFGPTLCQLFFEPFHELYTAGLDTRIAPQDAYKSPVNLDLVRQGASEEAPPVGYNSTFAYPTTDLRDLAQRMAARCTIHYRKRAIKIDLTHKNVSFADGSVVAYETLFSTLPLNQMLAMTAVNVPAAADPYTSVLVLNIGARRGARCPTEHWLYIPKSRTGFHRVGFYSNVDAAFLPESTRNDRTRVSIYVERAYPGGQRPTEAVLNQYAAAVVEELQAWGFIAETEVVDPTWIEVAYTWRYPDSDWQQRGLQRLREYDIYQLGRYGRWQFQGIAESIQEGLNITWEK